MATNRAFKGLANLRAGFEEPFVDDEVTTAALSTSSLLLPEPTSKVEAPAYAAEVKLSADTFISPVTGKVDRRRLRKVLKAPSVSLSVAIRAELHQEITALLFSQKSTWIAVLDELLTNHVAEAKATGRFPKYS